MGLYELDEMNHGFACNLAINLEDFKGLYYAYYRAYVERDWLAEFLELFVLNATSSSAFAICQALKPLIWERSRTLIISDCKSLFYFINPWWCISWNILLYPKTRNQLTIHWGFTGLVSSIHIPVAYASNCIEKTAMISERAGIVPITVRRLTKRKNHRAFLSYNTIRYLK